MTRKAASYHSVEEVKKKMARYCAYRDRSYFETEQKLKSYGLIPAAEDEIMAFLMQENFIDDERFARMYVRGKFYNKKWGKQKILQGLKQHRITETYINRAMQEIDEADYRRTMENLIRNKTAQLKESDPWILRKKLSAYMHAKGYTYEEFKEIIDDVIRKTRSV